ncbi:MAG: response regulator [Vicinamibacteria bacterium]
MPTDSAGVSKSSVSCALLAEPHHGLAEGIRSLLGTMFDAVVMVADETSLIEAAERLCPQLAVVELGLVRMDVDGFMCRLRARCPGLRVVFLSAHDEPTVTRSVLGAGANGFVVRRRVASDLIPALEAVLRGERYGIKV